MPIASTEQILKTLALFFAVILGSYGCGGGGGSGSDGSNEDGLDIAVVGEGPGAVALSWQRPELNEDGSQANDLGGFRVYLGTESPLSEDNATLVDFGNLTSVEIMGLRPGTMFFSVRAFDQSGNLSSFSDEVSVQIGD